LWHHAGVTRLRVIEFVRSPDPVWNLPRSHLERLAGDFPEIEFASPHDPTGVDAALPGADVMFGFGVRPDNFTRAEHLRWIHVTAASVASVLFPELVESAVVVTNGRGLHGAAMAEHTLGVMLSFARGLHLARDAQRERRWTQQELWVGPPSFGELAGSTLGVVGLGAVGRALAERARALLVEVVAVRRHPAADPAPAHAQWGTERLGELLERSHWVVLAAPLTAATRGLIGAPELARMRSDAVLINLGRGPLVDEPALIEALRAGRIAGAGLDVFEREPLPPDSPLWDMRNVIVTPHVSGLGPRYWERATDLFRRNLKAFLAGRPLENVVDKQAGY
jgi:phosphoglycerate dehydrogenase-like enzyme